MQIYGAVTVKSKDYENNQIASLVGKNITGWTVAGDLDLDDPETCILVLTTPLRDRTFDGVNMLPDALKYIATVLKGIK